MNTKYAVSVIIPCYNCEDTVSKCIESVINQTIGFDKIELILIDDKSKDKTREIITQYAEKYENIKPIFLKENSGYPGKPRNIGIKNATAKYIMFMDNDDTYDTKICENLFKEIKQEKADLATCNFINIDSYGYFYHDFGFKNGKEDQDKVIIENRDVNYFKLGVVWCSIFKKSIIEKNNITFPENKLYEDEWFVVNYLLNTRKIVYLNNYYGYLRNIRRDSTSQSLSIEKHNGSYDILEKCMDLFPEDYDLSFRYKSHILLAYTQLITTNLIIVNPQESYEFLKRLHKIEKKINLDEKLMMPFNIVNWFVMKENYKTALFLLKTISKIYKNKFFLRTYKKLSYKTKPIKTNT